MTEEGDRVQDAGEFRGTVRYVGPVCISRDPAATWIGVEWDDPTRGKHDGSVQSADGETVRYFSCAAGQGSFVKPNKLAARNTVTSALQERYGAGGASGMAADSELYAQTASGGHLQIQVVGTDLTRRQQDLSSIQEVALRGMRVASAGDDVAQVAPSITSLDLQQNLLRRWTDVAAVAAQLPLLHTLQLSENRLEAPPADADFGPAFAQLRVLVLNATGVAWETACGLARQMPALRELHLCRNGIAALGPGGGLPDGVATLNLSENALADWADVQASLGALPALQRLLLSGNPLPAVDVEPGSFAALESASLSGTGITSWASVDRLGQLPALTTLRFQSVPLTAGMGSSEARQILIARMAGIAHINGSEVRVKERADSEKAYVKRVANELAAAAAEAAGGEEETRARVLAAHPRFDALVALHGAPAAGAAGDGASTLASSMVAVTLQDLSANSAAPQSKRLPSTFTVANLKRLFTRLTTLAPDEQHILYRAPDDPLALPTWMDDEAKPLSFYGVVDGGTIACQELDREAAARDASRAEEEAQERLEAQLQQAEARRALRESEIEAERGGAVAGASS